MSIISRFRAWRTRRQVRKAFSQIRSNVRNSLTGGKQTKAKWEQQFSWYEGVIKRSQYQSKDVMETLRVIRDLNPDASMAIWNFLRLANQGHEMECLDKNGNEDTEGVNIINDLAKRVGKLYGGGMDQLINVMNLTAFTQGAVALDVELTERIDDVVDFHAVDPSTLEFRHDKETGEIELVQKRSDGRYEPLNQEQVFYYPIDPDIGDPYGRSPILPVLQIIFFQVEVLKDLKKVVHHQGHARFDIAIVEEAILKNVPQNIVSQGQEAIISFVEKYMESIEDAFNNLEPDDNFIHPDSVKVEMKGGTQGKSIDVAKIVDVINQQVVTSLKQLPILLGRNEGSTETHGTIQWKIYVAGIESIQRATKRLVEKAYNVALQVHGRQSRAKLTFNKLRVNDRFQEAQAEAIETRTRILQVNQGWIDNDEAAQEMVGHPAVGEPVTVTNASSVPLRGVRKVKKNERVAKIIRAEEDEWVKEVDYPWASDVARVTTEAYNWVFSRLQDQQETYIDRVKKAPKVPTRALIPIVRDESIPDPTEEFLDWLREYILDDTDKWIEEWENGSIIYLTEAAQIAGEVAIASLSVDISFDVKNENMLQILADRAKSFGMIQYTTEEAVMWELWEGAYNGESIGDMARRIEHMPQFDEARAHMVARTEVLTAARAGHQQAWRQSGVVIGKKWSTHIDDRTRVPHITANGQERKLDQPYDVGGELLMFPGDTSHGASLKNTINCRCGERPILQGENIDDDD